MSVLSRVIFSGVLKSSRASSCSSRLLPRNHRTESKNKLTSFALNKYVSFVKSYEETLKKNFPAAVKFYQVFSVGIKYFKEDALILFKAFKKGNSEGWHTLSRKELEVYYKMPRDIWRTAPVLLIGAGIPFCGFVFALAYYFPRQMLTYHFWSLQQRSEFSLLSHKKRLKYFGPLFRHLQNQLHLLEGNDLYEPMKQVLDCLGSGAHPSPELILSCKPLFEGPPFGLNNLPRTHIYNLLKLFELHTGWRRRKRLEFRANLMLLMDAAIIKEGGDLSKFTQDEIKWNCFIRGLNPINMRQEDIFKWMTTWLSISQKIDKNSYSLLLHCPVFLGYNQPSNWWLIHDNRR